MTGASPQAGIDLLRSAELASFSALVIPWKNFSTRFGNLESLDKYSFEGQLSLSEMKAVKLWSRMFLPEY